VKDAPRIDSAQIGEFYGFAQDKQNGTYFWGENEQTFVRVPLEGIREIALKHSNIFLMEDGSLI
jgi:hypothetical protein